MKKKATFVSAVVVVVCLVSNLHAEISPKYFVIDLGQGTALSINNNGQIVGQSRFQYGDSWFDHATLFDPNGTGNNIDLGTLGGSTSRAYSINDNGRIVGMASADHFDQYTYATLFDPNGTGNNVNLGGLGGNHSYAHAINNNSQIVGVSDIVAGTYSRRAALFDSNGTGNNINLGTLGGDYSSAHAINNNGLIVGQAWTSSELSHATIFGPNGTGNNVDLGLLVGGDISGARSINNKGQIVGWSAVPGPGYLDWRAVIFDPCDPNNNINLGTIDFDLPPTHNYSYAQSINDSGQIVGYADTAYGDYGVLFAPTGDGNNVDLNTLIDPDSELVIERAECINNNGWIVGYGRYNRLGSYRAILLKPVTCIAPIASDINDDCKVDFTDFMEMANSWMKCNLDPPEACW